MFQLGSENYFQSELVNLEMEEGDKKKTKNKRLRPREWAYGQKKKYKQEEAITQKSIIEAARLLGSWEWELDELIDKPC